MMIWFIFILASDIKYLCPYTGHINGTLKITNYRFYFQGDGVSDYASFVILEIFICGQTSPVV